MADKNDDPNNQPARPPCICQFVERINDDELPMYFWDSEIDCWLCPGCGDIYKL